MNEVPRNVAPRADPTDASLAAQWQAYINERITAQARGMAEEIGEVLATRRLQHWAEAAEQDRRLRCDLRCEFDERLAKVERQYEARLAELERRLETARGRCRSRACGERTTAPFAASSLSSAAQRFNASLSAPVRRQAAIIDNVSPAPAAMTSRSFSAATRVKLMLRATSQTPASEPLAVEPFAFSEETPPKREACAKTHSTGATATSQRGRRK